MFVGAPAHRDGIAFLNTIIGKEHDDDRVHQLIHRLRNNDGFATWIVAMASLGAEEAEQRAIEEQTATVTTTVTVTDEETEAAIKEDDDMAKALSADRRNVLSRPFRHMSTTQLRRVMSKMQTHRIIMRNRVDRVMGVSGVWVNAVNAGLAECVATSDRDAAYAAWLKLIQTTAGPSMDVSAWVLQSFMLSGVVDSLNALLEAELIAREAADAA